MNRVDFGKLVASLRKEHDDERGLPWTQDRLAREANRAAGAEFFNQFIISTIERGRRHPDERTLLPLATALQLTSHERREFFLAACGVDNVNLARQDNDPEEVLHQLMQRMAEIRLPSYIVDPYHDVVAASYAVIELMELESAGLGPGSQDQMPFPHNMVRFAFHNTDEEDSHLHRMIGDNWPDNLFQTMAVFRAFSLRYRGTEYFQALLQELRKCRQFLRYWSAVYYEDRDQFTESRKAHYQSRKWGQLEYYFWHLPAFTTAGELYLCIYVPASQDTAVTFESIAAKTANLPPIRVPTWPEKILLT